MDHLRHCRQRPLLTCANHDLGRQTLEALAKHFKAKITAPWKELPKELRTAILHGTKDPIKFVYDDGVRRYETTKNFEGVLPNLERRWKETDSAWVREDLEREDDLTAEVAEDAPRTRRAASA